MIFSDGGRRTGDDDMVLDKRVRRTVESGSSDRGDLPGPMAVGANDGDVDAVCESGADVGMVVEEDVDPTTAAYCDDMVELFLSDEVCRSRRRLSADPTVVW